MEKSGIFVGRPVLDSSGQLGTTEQLGTVDSGQWTGQRDTGRAILYWTEAARDSGQWTGQSGQKHCPYSRILRVTLASF